MRTPVKRWARFEGRYKSTVKNWSENSCASFSRISQIIRLARQDGDSGVAVFKSCRHDGRLMDLTVTGTVIQVPVEILVWPRASKNHERRAAAGGSNCSLNDTNLDSENARLNATISTTNHGTLQVLGRSLCIFVHIPAVPESSHESFFR
jgi:hypothetical protein